MGRASLNTELEQARGNGGQQPSTRPDDQPLPGGTPLAGPRSKVAGNNLNHLVKPNGAESHTEHDLAVKETTEMEQPELTKLDEFERLEAENTELRQQVANLEQALTDATKKAEYWEQQHQDQERLLEEKSDVIRELHAKIQQGPEPAAPRVHTPSKAAPSDEELLALEDELERERRQLKEDEEALMQQMRQMEVQMSRERAELARQRNDLQRLHSEVRHELELAARESELRERLQPLQRRYQEMSHRKGAEPLRDTPPTPPPGPPGPEAGSQPPKESSLFRRLFG